MLLEESHSFGKLLKLVVYINKLVCVTGHGKRAHFAHYFKIELLVFKGSVDLKQ